MVGSASPVLKTHVLQIGIGLLAFLVYAGFSLCYSQLHWGDSSLFHVSEYAYFNYLADAFIHGQLHLRMIPEITHDLVLAHHRFYLYWPPFPAVLLIPFVAIFGVAFSDVFFTLVIGAVNVSLTAALFARLRELHMVELPDFHNWMLVICFAFGTVHLTMAPLGRIWFTSQLLGYLFVLAAFLAAISVEDRKAFLITGLAISAAVATRNHLVFLGLWPAYHLLEKYRGRDKKWLAGSVAIGLAPLFATLASLAAYNFARFGSVTEMGLDLHQMAGAFSSEYQLYGAFHVHYLPLNFHYQYLFYPFPMSAESAMGGSLFLLTPLFFGAFFAFRIPVELSRLVLAVSILLTATPILLLMGTGWVQFGPRYTLDFMVPLLMLTALGIKSWPRWVIGLVVLISIVHYVLGTLFLSRILA